MPRPSQNSKEARLFRRFHLQRTKAEALGIPVDHLRGEMSYERRLEAHEWLVAECKKKREELGMAHPQTDTGAREGCLPQVEELDRREVKPAAKELASRELARRSLLHYIERTHPDYEAGWVHEDICRRLEQFVADVEAKKSPRLMLFLPPRSGKSLIASTYFPAWVLGKHPEWEFIMSSYAADLPIGFSRRVRAQLQSPEYKAVFPTTEMSKDSTSAESWRTTSSGGLRAAGVGGGITGMGAHCIPRSTPVYTDQGLRTINSLLKDGINGAEVLAFDGTRPVWRPINAVITRTADHIYRVTTENGVLEATGEHPVCVGTEGGRPVFRRVDDLRPGDRIVQLDTASTPRGSAVREMPNVRRRIHEGLREVFVGPGGLQRAGTHLLARLFGPLALCAGNAHQNLRYLWHGVFRTRVEGTAKNKKGAHPLGVFYRVLRKAAVDALRWLQPPSFHEGRGNLRSLWSHVLTSVFRFTERPVGAPLLQPGMLRQVAAWSAYDAPSDFPWGAILPPRVQNSAGLYEAGRSAVCEVFRPRHGFTSYRSKQGEQRPSQSGTVVPAMPQLGTPATVRSITRTDAPTEVADLAIEGAHNFFVGAGYLLFNCLLLDDVVKDQEAADSETNRAATWEWYSSTAYTRLAPGGGVVLVMTRWHHGDLAGRLIDKMNNDLKALSQQLSDANEALKEARTPEQLEEAKTVVSAIEEEYNSIDKWEIVEYQALATADEYLDRQTGKITKDEDEEPKDPQRFQLLRRSGEALHPARFPRPLLLKYKATMQPRHWAALYQQNPVPDEGLFFTKDLFRYRPNLPPTDELLTFAAWDLAIGSKNSNDYTVGIAVGIDYQDNLFVLDMLRGRWGDLDKVANYVIDLHKRYNCTLTGIEKGQLELALRPILGKVMKKRSTYIALAEGDSALKPITDKIVRARPLQGRMQQGSVLFPSDQPWVDALRNELLRFPAGTHDDCVDALAWAARMTSGVAPPPKPSLGANTEPFDGFKSWRDRLSLIMAGGRERTFMAR